MRSSIRILGNRMSLLDGGGHASDCHDLSTFDAAKRQLDRWRETYTFDYDEGLILLVEFFKHELVDEELMATLERVAKKLLKVRTLSYRGAMDLDFHVLHVLPIRLALRAAYEIGRGSVRRFLFPFFKARCIMKRSATKKSSKVGPVKKADGKGTSKGKKPGKKAKPKKPRSHDRRRSRPTSPSGPAAWMPPRRSWRRPASR
jgi:hypothetical protein